MTFACLPIRRRVAVSISRLPSLPSSSIEITWPATSFELGMQEALSFSSSWRNVSATKRVSSDRRKKNRAIVEKKTIRSRVWRDCHVAMFCFKASWSFGFCGFCKTFLKNSMRNKRLRLRALETIVKYKENSEDQQESNSQNLKLHLH